MKTIFLGIPWLKNWYHKRLRMKFIRMLNHSYYIEVCTNKINHPPHKVGFSRNKTTIRLDYYKWRATQCTKIECKTDPTTTTEILASPWHAGQRELYKTHKGQRFYTVQYNTPNGTFRHEWISITDEDYKLWTSMGDLTPTPADQIPKEPRYYY